MSPAEIKAIIHFSATPAEYEGLVPESLIRLGLLELDRNGGQSYKITEMGRVYVKALIDTPLPVQQWVMP